MKQCYFSYWINVFINLYKSMLVFINTVFVAEPEIWKYSIFLEIETCVFVFIKSLLRSCFVSNLFWWSRTQNRQNLFCKSTKPIHEGSTLLIPSHWGSDLNMWIWGGANIQSIHQSWPHYLWLMSEIPLRTEKEDREWSLAFEGYSRTVSI